MTLLCCMMYLAFLRGDIVIMRYEMTKWAVHKELGSNKEKFQTLTEQEALDLVNLHVKTRIVNTSNKYLLHYLRRYWKDYDQIQPATSLELEMPTS